MESCKSETAAKGGWTQQEDRLLLSAAQAARQAAMHSSSVAFSSISASCSMLMALSRACCRVSRAEAK